MEAPQKGEAMRTLVAASAIGTTIEWYDFLIYSTAASLVFGKLFFPTHDPLAGKLLAIGTIGVGFFVRPLGAIILSHFGDRIGRKSMLILTLPPPCGLQPPSLCRKGPVNVSDSWASGPNASLLSDTETFSSSTRQ